MAQFVGEMARRTGDFGAWDAIMGVLDASVEDAGWDEPESG